MTSSSRRGPKVKREFPLRCSKWWVIWEITHADWTCTARLVVITLAMQSPADMLTFLIMRR
jgi:hypothetical protein